MTVARTVTTTQAVMMAVCWFELSNGRGPAAVALASMMSVCHGKVQNSSSVLRAPFGALMEWFQRLEIPEIQVGLDHLYIPCLHGQM